ncbi:MAG: hypothetical protein IJW06_01395 [Clostridia bacterium]|nr:hypothetical protein [Clostridia bacterium]
MKTVSGNDCREFSGHMTVCAHCGYRFVTGERALWIKETGDIVHRDCFNDYTEDNIGEFTDEIIF